MKTAYLTGYTGKPTRTPAQLLQLAVNLNASVVDSRYNPASRVPHWNMRSLRELLRSRYMWARAFGNSAYKDGGISLVDPQEGLRQVENSGVDTVIILCACGDGAHCHRKQVGEYLAANGWDVREVTEQEWRQAQ